MEELKGFDFVVKVHENLLERPLTKYEFRLARSVYYSAVGEVLKEGGVNDRILQYRATV